jgi:hypothetical protein
MNTTPDWDEDYSEHNANLDNGGGPQGIGEFEEDWANLVARGHEIINADYSDEEVRLAAIIGRQRRTFVYYFTFGVGHKLIACLPEQHKTVNPYEQVGIPLAGMYVKIDATDETSAREEMIRRFGIYWSSCYNEASFQQLKYKYTELTL